MENDRPVRPTPFVSQSVQVFNHPAWAGPRAGIVLGLIDQPPREDGFQWAADVMVFEPPELGVPSATPFTVIRLLLYSLSCPDLPEFGPYAIDPNPPQFVR